MLALRTLLALVVNWSDFCYFAPVGCWCMSAESGIQVKAGYRYLMILNECLFL
jgi:hypothetical protein